MLLSRQRNNRSLSLFMSIEKTKFTNRLLVLANDKYFLGQLKRNDDLLKITRTFNCANLATVSLTFIGTFGFTFSDLSELASIDSLKFFGEGRVPEQVINNENDIYKLQEDRILFINFISAAFFGRITARKQTNLIGALYNGQDKITGFYTEQGMVAIQRTELTARPIEEKVEALSSEAYQNYCLENSEIDDAISYIHHLLQRQNEFEYADLKSCMVMNYQAAILHNQQHAGASLALNFSVIESLIGEIFHIYGLIQGKTIKPFATQHHQKLMVSKCAFKKMNLENRVKTLNEADLIGDYLRQRLDFVRGKRNKLMHKGERVSPKDSGECQTIVRDLWALCIDTPFELNMSWVYLR